MGSYLIDKALGVFRARKSLSETCKTKAVMNALVEDTSKPRFTFQNQNIGDTVFMQSRRCGKPCRTAADDDCLSVCCFHSSLSLPVNKYESLLLKQTSCLMQPVSCMIRSAGFDAGDRVNATGIADGCQNFSLCDCFATADNIAVIRVLSNHRSLLLRSLVPEACDSFTNGIKAGVGQKSLSLLQQPDDLTGDGNSTGKAR